MDAGAVRMARPLCAHAACRRGGVPRPSTLDLRTVGVLVQRRLLARSEAVPRQQALRTHGPATHAAEYMCGVRRSTVVERPHDADAIERRGGVATDERQLLKPGQRG